jgi:hypothetical protein
LYLKYLTFCDHTQTIWVWISHFYDQRLRLQICCYFYFTIWILPFYYFFFFSISSNNSKSFLWQRPAWMFFTLGCFVKILLTFYINISSPLNCYGFEYFKKHSRTVNCSFNQSTFLFAWKEKKCHLLLRSPFLNRGLSDGQKFWNNLCLAKVFFTLLLKSEKCEMWVVRHSN